MSRQQAQPENEIVAWYRSIPTCTRFLFTSFLAITLAGNFGLVNVYSLLYYPHIIFTKFQIFGWLLGIMLLNQCLVMAIIYLWSQEFRESIVTFIFGIRFKGSYFPWVLLAFDVLRRGDVMSTAVGIIAGHIYYYLQDLYPGTGGRRLLNTPQWLYRYFPPSSSGTRTSFGTASAPRNQNTAGEGSTHIWGRGQRLGSS
ncbi:Der1-like family-domain-containing protein [Gigaspora rosea]|uniref:Derlin n=1 Tax=Gigaspora rosea TaxID=44941 RepID=A0A397VC82_9GLOM|nr:Der1-like family-domain-containing protein [Gigaspora rosea]